MHKYTPRQQWSLLNHFRREQGHCGACWRKWWLTDTDLCPSGKTQTMYHIVESCPLTKLNGGLSRLHCANEDAVSWLTSYGSWHPYEKKKNGPTCTPCTIHTVTQDWWCRATLHHSHPWVRALGQPVRQASALVHDGGTCHLVKKERRTKETQHTRAI